MPSTPPKFLYFDLGNVLLWFDHRQAAQQMGEVAGISADKVWQVVFESGLEERFEAGQLDDQEFFETFCRDTGTRPSREALLEAGSAIFKMNASMIPVIAQLDTAGHRMGILSNTCGPHWSYCAAGRFVLICQAFDVLALSYQIGVCKPDPKIFAAAAKLAGVSPPEIFYTDDIAGNVDAARMAGFDAVQYTTTPQLVRDLRDRGVRFNY